MRRVGAALLLLASTAAPAAAEDLVLSLSSDRVVIASNFTGTEVVLFGAVQRDAASVPRRGTYDLVVTVRGPARDLVVRRKERVLGIWINRESRTFPGAPSYLAVIATRAPAEITSPAFRERYGIGLMEALPEPARRGPQSAEFREALLRLSEESGLYREIDGGARFLNEQLFRATIPVPANVPIGRFEVEVSLFADEVMLARKTTTLEVAKSGFEAQIAFMAEHRPLAYGVVAALLALVFGWAATVVFRRD
jgi:uncharacterized protein (TIGR02186 family)